MFFVHIKYWVNRPSIKFEAIKKELYRTYRKIFFQFNEWSLNIFFYSYEILISSIIDRSEMNRNSLKLIITWMRSITNILDGHNKKKFINQFSTYRSSSMEMIDNMFSIKIWRRYDGSRAQKICPVNSIIGIIYGQSSHVMHDWELYNRDWLAIRSIT